MLTYINSKEHGQKNDFVNSAFEEHRPIPLSEVDRLDLDPTEGVRRNCWIQCAAYGTLDKVPTPLNGIYDYVYHVSTRIN